MGISMISACAILLVAASHHIGNEGDYKELHPAFGVVCEHDVYGTFSTGYFRNSQDDDTVWLARRKYTDFAKSNYGKSFYEYGLVAGYSDYPLLPLVRVGYDFQPVKRVGAELFLMPGVESMNGKRNIFLVLGLQLKVK
jgi:hypothetical protein